MARRSKPEPAAHPISTCPFTDEQVEIIQLGRGMWIGKVSTPAGGYTTTPKMFKSEIEYFLSTRQGVPPSFPPKYSISTRQILPPPGDPVADLVEADQGIGEAADEAVAKTLRDAGVA